MNPKTPQSERSPSDDPAGFTAVAHPNIALVKYWGKRATQLNLPAVGSVSITLDALTSTTTLTLGEPVTADADSGRSVHEGAGEEGDGVDQLVLNGAVASQAQTDKLTELAAAFRDLTGINRSVIVHSENNFPTAAGLASSASGYAALVVALNEAFNASLDLKSLSTFARRGSGSAARSLFGGFAQMHKGVKDDGSDAFAEAVLARDEWPLEVVVAIASEHAKDVSSTVGMESTRTTSPFYQAWIETQDVDIASALDAIEACDFDALAQVAEYSCLKMHGLMLSAQPGLVYWNAATLACIHAVRTLRAEGCPVFFTIDAGPQLKAVCAPGAGAHVATVLQEIPGVSRVLRTGLGDGARVVTPQPVE